MPKSHELVAVSLGLCGVLGGLAACRQETDPGSTPPRSPAHRDLVAAVGESRFVEPRLTGGFPHARCEPAAPEEGRLLALPRCSSPPELGSEAFRRLDEARRRIRQQAGPDVRGLAHLLSPHLPGAPEKAVEALEEAVELELEEAGVWSDLAAAYLVQAQAVDDPFHLVLALDAAEQALELAPGLPEALFNRALALERLSLGLGAVPAWREVAAADPLSGWGEESAGRARRLDSAEQQVEWAGSKRALLGGDAGAVNPAITSDRRLVRTLMLDELLPAWAEARRAGDRSTAGQLLEVAHAAGERLVEVSGDHTVSGAVAAIERAEALGTEATDRLAEAHREYGRGRALLGGSGYLAALEPFETVRRLAADTRSPLAPWAEYQLAAIASTANDYAGAFERAKRLRRDTDLATLPALAARLHWVQGLVEVRTGLFADSLESFRSAAGLYSQMGEEVLAAAATALAAESDQALGQDEDAWAARLTALHRLGGRPSGFLHNLLLDAAKAAAGAGAPRAALTLQTVGTANAEALVDDGRDESWLVEALLWRSKTSTALDRFAAAQADLDRAEAQVPAIDDDEVRRRLDADLREARGLLYLETAPDRAVRFLGETAEFFEQIDYTFRLPGVYLASARARLATGDADGAERDLDAGIAEFERRDRDLQADLFRYEHFERAQELFDAMIRLQYDRGRPLAALAFSERARISTLQRVAQAGRALRGDDTPADAAQEPVTVDDLEAAAGRLPDDVVLVEYALLPDRVLAWRVAGGEIRSWELEPTTAELSARANAFYVALASRAPENEIDHLGEIIHKDLIEPVLSDVEPESHLVFVPDRALARVPFAALRDKNTGRYLIEDYPVSNTLGLIFYAGGDGRRSGPRQAGDSPRALLVGNPATGDLDLAALEAAERAAEELATSYPGATLLTGKDADESAVLSALQQAKLFYYAGHGINDDARPWASYLALAPGPSGDDGRLHAHELLGLDLGDLDLVVLSACQSAGARDDRTMAVSGLALAFLNAGASSVVANLWDVEDRAAGELLSGMQGRRSAGLIDPSTYRETVLAKLESDRRSEISDWPALVWWSRL